jgi:hypothetical protein
MSAGSRRTGRPALLAAGLSIVAILTGCGEGTGDVTVRELGDTTTKEAVIAALEGTGYEIRFRQVPHLQGYEIVAGEASKGDQKVAFAVEIETGGDSDGNPQPAIVPYSVRGESTVEGNVMIRTQTQAPETAGSGFEIEPDKTERRMEIEIGLALNRLFAPRFRQGI